MRAFFLVILAMACYASQNVIVDQKLRPIHPIAVTAIVTGTGCLISCLILAGRQVFGLPTVLPSGPQILFVIMAGLFVCAADISFFFGYKAGASLALATTAPITLPLFAWGFNYLFFSRRTPSLYELIGWVLAGAALTMVYLGRSEDLSR
ncbi:MAG: hypothetical protein UX09_C0012G0010 [Candidatus Uhrbacteria bacterium GW2011_GWE2_45_35]|uniref:EamA domain-containing protein n=2 Tax=Candidatus Uhriibacteriota TaxID=1752732 RepID=A0A0G1JJL1_9BACT|nr:MAG: hypothetical protein UW63_C0013G0009 [Candidatus Uhrbacteria bacterium GW2011_GWF2_44_350]KKU08797.1 MAG: hypothetical protein UX09_C0012G0010 [Candidatus Uhrbacteria bacterium GW2011_GWE2_45_35]